jgi:hypothetical protein
MIKNNKKFLIIDVKHDFSSLLNYEVVRRLRIFSEAFSLEFLICYNSNFPLPEKMLQQKFEF